MRKKVSVVGSGNVGATAAHWIASKELADVVSHRHPGGHSQGKALDLQHAMPIEEARLPTLSAPTITETRPAPTIVVITAGIPRKPGMSRDDLLNTNYNIMKSVVTEAIKYSPGCILIIVSNPLDAMAQTAYKLSGFPRNRVIGMAGVLDSARFRYLHCRRTQRQRRERDGLCPRRPRRHHGTSAALFHRGWHSDHGADHTRAPGGSGAAHPRRRC